MKPRIINEEYILAPVASLTSHPRNPRRGNVDAIVESVEGNGFFGAVVVQRSTGHILVGNHRWMAAQKAGLPTIPVIFVDCDDDRALRILLADNRTNDIAGYDGAALAALLRGILDSTGTLAMTGYDPAAAEKIIAAALAASGKAGAPTVPIVRNAGMAEIAPDDEERAALAGRILIIEFSGGKDSLAAAAWARQFFPGADIRLLFAELGADFVGYHRHIVAAAEALGLPFVMRRSRENIIDHMLSKGEWPHPLFPYCHGVLHQALDDYLREFDPGTVAILRGGRRAEKARNKAPNPDRWLTIDRMRCYRYFQPLYFTDKDTSARIVAEAGLPLWEGYSRGLHRTACRICPGQKPRAYVAIRREFPDVWAELLWLEGRFGKGTWRDHGRATFATLADKGERMIAGDLPDGDDLDPGLPEGDTGEA